MREDRVAAARRGRRSSCGRRDEEQTSKEASIAHRTVGVLRKRAQEIVQARESAAAEWREAERRRQAEEAEKVLRARLKALKRQGASVWREIEEEIERRNASGYDRAANLLSDLQALAVERGSQADFSRRLASIRARHEKKGKFIERLTRLGCNSGDGTLDSRDC